MAKAGPDSNPCTSASRGSSDGVSASENRMAPMTSPISENCLTNRIGHVDICMFSSYPDKPT